MSSLMYINEILNYFNLKFLKYNISENNFQF